MGILDDGAREPGDPGRQIGEYYPGVVVRFRNLAEFQVPYAAGAQRSFPPDLRQSWEGLQEKYAEGQELHLVPLPGPPGPGAEGAGAVHAGAGDAAPVPPPATGWYFAIEVPARVDPRQLVLGLMRRSDLVQAAYVESCPAWTEELRPAPPDPESLRQRYLDANWGIAVRSVHSIFRGPEPTLAMLDDAAHGKGIRIAVIDQGWSLNSPDLEAVEDRVQTLDADRPPRRGYKQHGKQVLALLLAPHDGRGCEGIVPRADVLIGSAWQRTGQGRCLWDPAGAIDIATRRLSRGDVILLELQNNQTDDEGADVQRVDSWPIEVEAGVFPAIRRAVDAGIVVVEPAGNGGPARGFCLDDYAEGEDRPLGRNPAGAGYRDSGAILVAACQPPAMGADPQKLRLRRWAGSNFGSRVDCCAWGEGVLAQAGGAGTFSGTSSAAAIIAGAAACVQALAKVRTGAVLAPGALRTLFGTKGASGREEGIGVMPDVQAIVDSLNIAMA